MEVKTAQELIRKTLCLMKMEPRFFLVSKVIIMQERGLFSKPGSRTPV